MSKPARRPSSFPASSPPAAATAAPGTPDGGRRFLLGAAIVALGVIAFWPTLSAGFVWDDSHEITLNAALRDPDGWWKFWIAPPTDDYFPLKFTIHWIMWRLWQDTAAGYHFANLALHLWGALLVWRLLRKLRAPGAWLGGALFAIHPLVVESVAWVSEIKNTASLPPLLLAACAYLDFDEHGRPRDYAAALAWFLAALLVKTSVVMFPVVILLHAWWRRGRIARRDLGASALFFATALVLGFVTVWFQQTRAIRHEVLPMGDFVVQFARAGLAIVFYLGKCLAPVGLLPVYPRWNVDPASLAPWLAWLALAALAAWCWAERATWGRHVLFALGFFVANLFPVLGFLPMSYMRFSWVADHFVYLSLVGFVGLAAAGLARLLAFLAAPARRAVVGGAAALVALCGAATFAYAKNFHDDIALWSYTLARNPTLWQAEDNLGLALLAAGEPEPAAAHFRRTLELNPDCDDAHYNLGNVLIRLGQRDEAAQQFEATLRLKPASADAHINLGNLLLDAGRTEEALHHFTEGVRLAPGSPEAHANLGNALTQLQRLPEAIAEYEKALALRPGYGVGHYNLGNAFFYAGRYREAVEQYEEAVSLLPDSTDARRNLSIARSKLGL
ncbi:MAG TPA: tetratricopeptide repeat protein [Opitutaceae bacterium]|nr:tetratricopeptide repeat protein [Opitutaceae bacterium]